MDQNKLSGLGSHDNEWEHQSIQSLVFFNLKFKFRGLNIFTETKLTNTPPRITPDISIWEINKRTKNRGKDESPGNPIFILEITHCPKNDEYSEGNIRKAFKRFPTIQEGFIYNYSDNLWIRFTNDNGDAIREENKDYSRVLKSYLHTLLK